MTDAGIRCLPAFVRARESGHAARPCSRSFPSRAGTEGSLIECWGWAHELDSVHLGPVVHLLEVDTHLARLPSSSRSSRTRRSGELTHGLPVTQALGEHRPTRRPATADADPRRHRSNCEHAEWQSRRAANNPDRRPQMTAEEVSPARAAWRLGDYHRFARQQMWEVGPVLVAACGVAPGQRVLDVAAGTGNVAIRRRRRARR
jgi:hypothetical protein